MPPAKNFSAFLRRPGCPIWLSLPRVFNGQFGLCCTKIRQLGDNRTVGRVEHIECVLDWFKPRLIQNAFQQSVGGNSLWQGRCEIDRHVRKFRTEQTFRPSLLMPYGSYRQSVHERS